MEILKLSEGEVVKFIGDSIFIFPNSGKIIVFKDDENGNVLVFCASFVSAKLPGQSMSDGHIEINRTLWKQDSEKRPEGYWVLGSNESNGVMKSYFVSDEWLDNTPEETTRQKRAEWGV